MNQKIIQLFLVGICLVVSSTSSADSSPASNHSNVLEPATAAVNSNSTRSERQIEFKNEDAGSNITNPESGRQLQHFKRNYNSDTLQYPGNVNSEKGKIYTFELPLYPYPDDNEGRPDDTRAHGPQEQGNIYPEGNEYLEELRNEIPDVYSQHAPQKERRPYTNSEDKDAPQRISGTNFDSTQDKENANVETKEETPKSPYGNDTQIGEAGIGLLHIAQPQIQYGQQSLEPQLHLQQPYYQEIPIHNEGQGVPLHPVVQVQEGFIPVASPHGPVPNDGVTQFHGPEPHGQIHPPHPKIVVHEHHHPPPLPKPLKPSIVHRDPHDYYYHHDKIRTLDEDGHRKIHEYPRYPSPVNHHDHGKAEYYKPYVVQDHHGFRPYNYDMKKIPECAHKNKHFYNLTFCLEDHLYPVVSRETILWALHHQHDLAAKLLSDITYQSADNLVSGLTRVEEEGYTYKHYFGANHAQHINLDMYKPPYHGYRYKTDYYKHGGYICPSDIYYGRPKRAMNTYGEWKVIVNIDHIPKHDHHPHGHPTIHPHAPHQLELGIHKKREIYFPHKGHTLPQKGYTQTLRLEQCIYPNAPCSYIDPHFHSSCIQKHNFVRLVAWTFEEGLHIDTFKMPIACSCHIPQPIHFYHEDGHHTETYGKAVPPVNAYTHDDRIK